MTSSNRQCAYCGSKVFSSYGMKGWRIMCSHCDYETPNYTSELEAEGDYRKDYNQEFKKSITPVPIPIERGWTRVTDRIPQLKPDWDDGVDNREVEVQFEDGSKATSNVSALHSNVHIVAWRWYEEIRRDETDTED